MKKRFTILACCLIIGNMGFRQNPFLDSVRYQVEYANQDTSRISAMIRLATEYMFTRPDSSIIYGSQAISLANRIDNPAYKASAMIILARAYRTLGNDTKALQIILEGLNIAEAINLTGAKATLLMQSGDIYANSKRYKKALEVLREAQVHFDSTSVYMSANTQNYIGQTYLMMSLEDSALFYFQSVYNLDDDHQLPEGLINKCLINLGKVQAAKGNTEAALNYYFQSRQVANDAASNYNSYFQIAGLYKEMENTDSSAYYGQLALNVAMKNGLFKNLIDAGELLSDIYEGTDYEKALRYKTLASSYKDSLFTLSNNAAIEGFSDFDKREQQYELDVAEAEYKNRLRTNAFLGSTFTLLIIGFFLYRNNRNKQKSKQKIEKAYEELKSTQSQLIQSEKMASLGELTAGIAHEIQNPLNFVNNFSDVNKELTDELLEEVEKGNKQEAKAIIKDIRENEEKILHHGQRADAIVKGMLQHSRSGSGEKEPTDINALCDEYLRLSYHGMRAKDKSFNADFKTELDPDLPKINVVPQDIGRVLLNLINNAFYAVSAEALAKAGGDFKPEVIVTTRRVNSPLGAGGTVEISISDNGPGIPDSIKDKIFQPFFTTKATGQGTGLGLSLSYDIITKGHGGTLEVKSSESNGTEFIFVLPVNQS